MSIYGTYLQEAYNKKNVNEAGSLLDAPKLIKDFIKKYKENKAKQRKEKEAKEKAKMQQKENQEKYKKNKDEFDSLSNEDKQAMKKLLTQKEKEFEKLAKTELKKLMGNSEYKAKVRKAIDKGFEDGLLDPEYDKAFYNTNKLPKTVVENGGDYWTIIDESQEICIACNCIVNDLAKILSDITGYTIDTGDGDEGCIYPLQLIDYFSFYYDVYKKEIKKEA